MGTVISFVMYTTALQGQANLSNQSTEINRKIVCDRPEPFVMEDKQATGDSDAFHFIRYSHEKNLMCVELR